MPDPVSVIVTVIGSPAGFATSFILLSILAYIAIYTINHYTGGDI